MLFFVPLSWGCTLPGLVEPYEGCVHLVSLCVIVWEIEQGVIKSYVHINKQPKW